MITTIDIANIIYKDLQLDIKLYQKGNIPEGEVKEERIIIIPKRFLNENRWKKGFVEVNFCVPDLNGKANLIRLNELEKIAAKIEKTGVYDGTPYTYSTSDGSINIEKDIPLKCHYVNLSLLFCGLNTK